MGSIWPLYPQKFRRQAGVLPTFDPEFVSAIALVGTNLPQKGKIALAENQSAVEVLGDKQLAIIATELVMTVRQNTTIDWTVKESVKAKLRVLVRRALRKYGYPPDLQEAAVQTVLQQAELLALEQVACGGLRHICPELLRPLWAKGS